MARKKGTSPPGDIRLDPLDVMTCEQPLDARGKELVKRGYALFDTFRDRLRGEHTDMLSARKMRQLAQDSRSRTGRAFWRDRKCVV